jgi:hypothetical protein
MQQHITLACMTLSHTEEVEDESKEYIPTVIYIYNQSAVEIIISFKVTKMQDISDTNFILSRQEGVQIVCHTLAWISNQSMVADTMSHVLPKKDHQD